MPGIPNCGVRFRLGSYKVELFLNTGYGHSRKFMIENEGDTVGLYSDELIDQLQNDIENLRETARRCVTNAEKESARYDLAYFAKRD